MTPMKNSSSEGEFTRRTALATLLSSVSVLSFGLIGAPVAQAQNKGFAILPLKNSDWEGLNPGYWTFERKSIRRALRAVGDRARRTGFPYHYESHAVADGVMPRDYDPSLPLGIHWNRNWKLSGTYKVSIEAKVLGNTKVQRKTDNSEWDMYGLDYAVMGIAFGGNTLFESFYPTHQAAPLLVLRENGEFGFVRHTKSSLEAVSQSSTMATKPLGKGDKVSISLEVNQDTASATLLRNGKPTGTVQMTSTQEDMAGYFGIAARGLMDFCIDEVAVDPKATSALNAPQNDCHVCYALGDTLSDTPKGWSVKFMALFRTDGKRAEVRISDTPKPSGGWKSVPVAGFAGIISNDFRENTSIITAVLPADPSTKTLYYTVWKDGVDVTRDNRPGTDSVGPGTGMVGDIPNQGDYIGRLPQLTPPYRLAGLSCHAVHTANKHDLDDPGADRGGAGLHVKERSRFAVHEPFFVHDQPCYNAYKHIEDFDYQIMLWEDDIWYMELLLYPPSTADAYRQVTLAIGGPTTRWQMMRHWNVLNPGDHDHGMDDVKGPEQLLIRNRDDLGQDPTYMARNFQIVSHLMQGDETPSGVANPKRWRKWKMPKGDFSLIVTDARLWRTSQDTAIWDDEGWDHDAELYTRKDPTRTLLGEEQFAWLSREVRTDSSPLMCVTGMNALHTIWAGHLGKGWSDGLLERDRVSADYSGWVSAGADRVLDLLSSRTGIVTVYGDVHSGSIVRNKDLNVFECSFGPIGRWGSRALIKDFGRNMKDDDGRDIECIALYHHKFSDPDLTPQEDVNYWNVLEAHFDPRPSDPEISLKIRNITDTPSDPGRGGGVAQITASQTGKPATSKVPAFDTLKAADVLFLNSDNQPIRGTRSDAAGNVAPVWLSGVKAGERITVLAQDQKVSKTLTLVTESV